MLVKISGQLATTTTTKRAQRLIIKVHHETECTWTNQRKEQNHQRWHSLRRFTTQQEATTANSSSSGKDFRTAFGEGSASPLVPEPPVLLGKEQLERLTDFVGSSKRLVVITGAGISTESGVPDYRSPNGSYSKGHKPVTYSDFVRSQSVRQRYWARNMEAWPYWSSVQPNKTHSVLAEFEKRGIVKHIVTQNVDRLHHKAGSSDVTELHGNSYEVKCLKCGNFHTRSNFQDILRSHNPTWKTTFVSRDRNPLPINKPPNNQNQPQTADKITLREGARPDGDIDLGEVDYSKFNVPNCEVCKEGMYKPMVVFFGENVPLTTVKATMDLVHQSDRILVAGTSLMVYSVFRFIDAAVKQKTPFAIINIGPTRGDAMAALKIEGQCGEVFSYMQSRILQS